ERQSLIGREAAVRCHGIAAHADHLGPRRRERVVAVPERPGLDRAPRRLVLGIEVQPHALPPHQITQPYGRPRLIRQREVRRHVSDPHLRSFRHPLPPLVVMVLYMAPAVRPGPPGNRGVNVPPPPHPASPCSCASAAAAAAKARSTPRTAGTAARTTASSPGESPGRSQSSEPSTEPAGRAYRSRRAAR